VVKYYTVSRAVSFSAERLCLSPKHFGAIIREATGINPGDWISRYVINAAKTLLTTRLDLSIQQICDMLGFKEQTAFSRYFRRETGTTPKDFRKANKRI
jgi:AraC-like DNA-binding protein